MVKFILLNLPKVIGSKLVIWDAASVNGETRLSKICSVPSSERVSDGRDELPVERTRSSILEAAGISDQLPDL